MPVHPDHTPASRVSPARVGRGVVSAAGDISDRAGRSEVEASQLIEQLQAQLAEYHRHVESLRVRLTEHRQHADLLCRERDLARQQADALRARLAHSDSTRAPVRAPAPAPRDPGRTQRVRARAQTLRQCYLAELGRLPPRHRAQLPTSIARALRGRVGVPGHWSADLVPGTLPPQLVGSPGYWRSASGSRYVRDPEAYRRAGGRPQYHPSTETILVGRRWLRDHIRGLARDQAEREVH